MSTIRSEVVSVPASASDTFAFLSDLNHFEQLMPEDRVTDWESDVDSCRFQIKGLAKIGFRAEKRDAPTLLHLVSDGKNPFPFRLDIHLEETGADSCNARLEFSGKMNPMLSMMATKPLTNFFNMLATRLSEVMG